MQKCYFSKRLIVESMLIELVWIDSPVARIPFKYMEPLKGWYEKSLANKHFGGCIRSSISAATTFKKNCLVVRLKDTIYKMLILLMLKIFLPVDPDRRLIWYPVRGPTFWLKSDMPKPHSSGVWSATWAHSFGHLEKCVLFNSRTYTSRLKSAGSEKRQVGRFY
jgi:hypothetical protein